MRTGNTFVNVFTATRNAGKIVSGKTENIVTAIFTFNCKYFGQPGTNNCQNIEKTHIQYYVHEVSACYSHTSKFYTFLPLIS